MLIKESTIQILNTDEDAEGVIKIKPTFHILLSQFFDFIVNLD